MGKWIIPETTLSPLQKAWSAAIGGGLAVALLFGALTWWLSLPAADPDPPFDIISDTISYPTEAEWLAEERNAGRTYPAGGIWRIETEGVYHTRCATVVVERTFAGDGDVWRQRPYSGWIVDKDGAAGFVDPLYAARGVLGKRTVIAEYEMTRAVSAGSYVVDREAWNCEPVSPGAQGWSGRLPQRVVEFTWPAP